MTKGPTEAEIGGMTVNERLYAVGLLKERDSAAAGVVPDEAVNGAIRRMAQNPLGLPRTE